MKMSYKEKCPNCEAEIYYSDNEKLIKCTSCGNTLVVAEFVREQQKIEQQLAEGETAKAELAKAKQEKQKAQEALCETVQALDGIQKDQHAQRETLEQLLDSQHADRSLHDNILLLLQTIQGEQRDENGFLNHLLYNIGAEQKTADEKLESISNIAAQLRQNQNNTEKMISVLNEHLSVSDREKKKLIDEYIEWQNNVHKEDVERLERIQNSSNSILNALKKMDDEIDRTHTEISKVEDAVKGFESKWETDRRKKLIAKYKTAEKLQRERRFDEAQKYYQDVLINGGQDPEVYWRVLMCHYCIEYQRDDEGKEIPTILYPDLSDPNEVMERINLLEILDSTDRELREYYYIKLKAIDTILDKYRRWQYKLQYDVFISVKQTDKANGKKHPTDDYKVGLKLYDYLTSLGLKVFNSEKTKGPAGEEWEPYILAALMSARVMIVVGTRSEYMESQWVKNEWTRYQWLQKLEKDQNKKRLLFCYLSGGMTAEQLPKGLNPSIEAIVEGIGVQTELFNSLKGVFPQIEQKSKVEYIYPNANAGIESIRQRMSNWLAYGKYDRVIEEHQKIIDEGIYSQDVFIGLCYICAKHKLSQVSMLETANIDLSQDEIIQIILKNNKNHNDLKMLDDLLDKNKKNREEKCEEKPKNPAFDGYSISQSVDPEMDSIQWNEDQRESTKNVALGELLVGKIYSTVMKDDVRSAVWYRKSAEKGNVVAQYNLGNMYRNALGMKKDYIEAFEWFRRSAEKGNAEAQYAVGDMYKNGLGTKKNYAKAFEWFLRSAEKGNADAQYAVGDMCKNGLGTKENYVKAFEWFLRSAEKGNADAQYAVGDMYEEGLGIKKNYVEAIAWYRRSAEKRNMNAQYALGNMYRNGHSVKQDLNKAVEWYQKAADQGHVLAQSALLAIKRE